MTNLEKMKIFYEDIFGASVFWENDETKDCIKIFVDDFRGRDVLKMIDDALKRPPRSVKPEDLTCVGHGELGYIKISEESDEYKYCIHHTGYIPYELKAYVWYFTDSEISDYPQGDEIKKAMDNYFKARNIE
ncbi:MAG: hypothetical protein LBP79_02000 [Clostridiales bacterium]|jgi:hypothetical protein|nr:hypothetical protein [Clostridiales bacterium]